MAPETLLVGSVKVTEPLGAVAASAATEMAAGAETLRAWLILPLAAVNTKVPARAVIGALMLMLWSAASVRLFALLHATGDATVMVPPRGAVALEEVDTVTFPKPNSFCRSATDRTDVGFDPVIVNGAEPGQLDVAAASVPVSIMISRGIEQ